MLKDGSATGVGDTVTPNPDGTFSIPLVVPADATPGGDYSVQVDCGNEQVITETVTLPLQVAVPTTTTGPAVRRECPPSPAEPLFRSHPPPGSAPAGRAAARPVAGSTR